MIEQVAHYWQVAAVGCIVEGGCVPLIPLVYIAALNLYLDMAGLETHVSSFEGKLATCFDELFSACELPT